MKENQNWVALHAFYHNIPQYDNLISDIANVLDDYRKNNKIEKWFFIRYWEGGPHIRFRMLNPKSCDLEKNLIKRIQNYIKMHPTEKPYTREEYYKDNKFDGEPIDISTLQWYEEGQVAKIEYQRENERYGGEEVIEISESIFMYSSYIVKNIISATKNDFNKKLLAAALTYILIKEFRSVYKEENTKDFLSVYKSRWVNFRYNTENEDKIQEFFYKNKNAIKSAISILKRNSEIKNLIETIKSLIKEKFDKVRDIKYMEYIIASHIHMTNNRLGAAPIFEYFISDVLINIIDEGGL